MWMVDGVGYQFNEWIRLIVVCASDQRPNAYFVLFDVEKNPRWFQYSMCTAHTVRNEWHWQLIWRPFNCFVNEYYKLTNWFLGSWKCQTSFDSIISMKWIYLVNWTIKFYQIDWYTFNHSLEWNEMVFGFVGRSNQSNWNWYFNREKAANYRIDRPLCQRTAHLFGFCTANSPFSRNFVNGSPFQSETEWNEAIYLTDVSN